MELQSRQGWKGEYHIWVTTDEQGRITVNGAGNLTIAEIILATELFKDELMKKGQGVGVVGLGGLQPKRF